jgi:predicted phage terminase large subunit-like protein
MTQKEKQEEKMNVKELSWRLVDEAKRHPYSYTPYEGVYSACKLLYEESIEDGKVLSKWLSEALESVMPTMVKVDIAEARQMYELHKATLLLAAPYDFDSYLQYVEWEREPRKKFYMPRRKQLKVIVDALQELADDKLDTLCISVPPGCGKSGTAIFFLTWMAGRIPDAPILTGSHSNSWVRGAYDECLRIFDKDGEYLWCDVFPDVAVSNTNAKDCRIDLGKRKRFETLEFTSIGSGNAGLYRASTLLYCDDLVSGIEVAMSKDRLDKLWEIYNTDLRQRKIGRCKELHIATRWSVYDVLGRLEAEYGGTDRARFIVLPAVDENDESLWDYPYNLGYSTKMLHEQREIMDDVNWRALFMNQPIEREGQLYSQDELRRYFELPDGEPDAILAVCDGKTKGDDYCVMPIAYQYGPDFYIEDVICDNNAPNTVDPRLASILLKHNVHMARFESNQAGLKLAEKIQGMVKDGGGRTKITTKYTTANKTTRIVMAQPWVLEHCLFKDESVKYGKEYRKFLQFLCGWTMSGRNPHDDVPDAMAQLAEFIQSFALNRVEIVKRPF